MNGAENRPIELKLERDKHLRIQWADGCASVIPLDELRRACPCASCREAREQFRGGGLTVLQPEPDLALMTTAETAELVGNYGLRVRWRDGHDAGIYDFAMLRTLGRIDPV